MDARAIPGNVPGARGSAPGAAAASVLEQNRRVSTPFVVDKTRREASRAWDKFYKAHEDRFFRDRHWTDREFASLRAADGEEGIEQALGQGAQGAQDAPVLLEVGCGVGNTIYPLLEKNAALKAYACDFSPRAVAMVKEHGAYTPERVHAFVYDLVREKGTLRAHLATRRGWPPVSTLSLIFVLSAIPPHEHAAVLAALVDAVPVGATLVFRDYARCDIAQLRFHTRKDAQWAEPSLLSTDYDWYRRGDETMAYFFTKDEVERLMHSTGRLAGTVEEVVKTNTNRRTGVLMERRFIQAQLRKTS
ncbi:hypothetical protein MVES1_003462 [Malassezia vespertilionis]|uniref:tRNA N(3)-methylcytidine methyltransferase n=1 Tax=Malassezia vespertilionis TaxID=2020962 RepID=A0A2N1J7C3_9BASI|nr:uncharacterized protein MVES1_003462 [Malassezia vespertilionis]PKI82453.1 hypothetical protein MVES_003701 [Malassezia vespertilionis]WFD08093.1 hypothetical protein MVES1_003462 [Malassezia vespertilionis]